MNIHPFFSLTCCGLAAATATPVTARPQKPRSQEPRPNIVVILADDLGYSDLGCYGSEIRTPVLDALASDGVRFTQMYNSGRSCPSRACLLTGLYPHRVGIGEMVRDHREAWPEGYRGYRTDNNLTIAQVLSREGYYTALSGKWHLGKHATPVDCGFDDFYGFMNGAAPYWNEARYVRLPESAPRREYPEGTFYATNAITDYAIDFVRRAQEQHKPFFLHLTYNAPHFPLQAPKERIDAYMETYLQGWDRIRADREQRLRAAGLLPDGQRMGARGEVPASAFTDETRPIEAWDDLPEETRRDLARRMATYAAMVEIMDENIGRFIEALRTDGVLDNTLILFLSDNGACAEWHEFGFDGRSGVDYRTHTGDALERMGQRGTYHHYGTGWARLLRTVPPLQTFRPRRRNLHAEYSVVGRPGAQQRPDRSPDVPFHGHHDHLSRRGGRPVPRIVRGPAVGATRRHLHSADRRRTQNSLPPHLRRARGQPHGTHRTLEISRILLQRSGMGAVRHRPRPHGTA